MDLVVRVEVKFAFLMLKFSEAVRNRPLVNREREVSFDYQKSMSVRMNRIHVLLQRTCVNNRFAPNFVLALLLALSSDMFHPISNL